MDSRDWDARYSSAELVWSAGPNQFVEEFAQDLPAGRALDLAGGEGRNALWLASLGWDATCVDFSHVALERAAAIAEARSEVGSRFHTVQADLSDYEPPQRAFDLVLVVYLQVAADLRSRVFAAAASAVAPAGHLMIVAHESSNLTDGVGGPQDPTVLYSTPDVAEDLAESGLVLDRAEIVLRPVDIDGRVAYAHDLVVIASRP